MDTKPLKGLLALLGASLLLGAGCGPVPTGRTEEERVPPSTVTPPPQFIPSEPVSVPTPPIPEPVTTPPLDTPPLLSVPANKNRALDVIAYLDTDSFPGVTENDVRRVLARTGELFFAKTGIHIVVRDVQSVSLNNLVVTVDNTYPLIDWARTHNLTHKAESVIIFSKLLTNWQTGGFAESAAFDDSSVEYCNEFDGLAGQRGFSIPVIDFHHHFSRCGYDENSFPGTNRISEVPTQGECSNNPNDICVLRSDRLYYQCQSTVQDVYSDLDFFTATSIIHELSHGIDLDAYGHYGEYPKCTLEAIDRNDAQLNFGMCPKTFSQFSSHLKGCP